MKKRIIDIHTHIAYWPLYSKTFLNDIVNELIKQGIPYHYVEKMLKVVLSDRFGDKLIQQMDDAGIEKSVLLCTDFDFRKDDTPYSIQRMHDIHLEQLKRHKDRFIIFAGVSPFRGDENYAFIANYIERRDFKGIKLYPPIGFRLTDKRLSKYFELCNYYALPIMIHTGPSVQGFKQIDDYKKEVEIITSKYKNAKFILAHGAIYDYENSIKLAKNINNVYLDISSYQGVIDNKLELKNKLKECFESIPFKVLFGTDWPMYNFSNSQNDWIIKLKELDIMDDKMEDLLMYKNAETVLDLD